MSSAQILVPAVSTLFGAAIAAVASILGGYYSIKGEHKNQLARDLSKSRAQCDAMREWLYIEMLAHGQQLVQNLEAANANKLGLLSQLNSPANGEVLGNLAAGIVYPEAGRAIINHNLINEYAMLKSAEKIYLYTYSTNILVAKRELHEITTSGNYKKNLTNSQYYDNIMNGITTCFDMLYFLASELGGNLKKRGSSDPDNTIQSGLEVIQSLEALDDIRWRVAGEYDALRLRRATRQEKQNKESGAVSMRFITKLFSKSGRKSIGIDEFDKQERAKMLEAMQKIEPKTGLTHGEIIQRNTNYQKKRHAAEMERILRS